MTEINKVVYGGNTLIDLTNDDVTASDVKSGVYFHDASGVRSAGTMAVSDTKVTQNPTTANGSYRVVVSKSADDTAETDTVGKTSRVFINPYTGDIGLYTSGSEDLDTALASLGWTSDVSW